MASRQILIAGGGIGGLTLANALQRCGIPFKVLEQAPAFGDVGFGITIAHNGLRALEKINPDLEQRVFKAAVQNVETVMVDQDGNMLFKNPEAWTPAKAKYGHARYIPISRTRLQQELLRDISEKDVVLESSIEAFEQGDSGVSVRTASGDTFEGAALVGCDGLHSRTRSLLHTAYQEELGPEPEVAYSGLSLWGGNLSGFEELVPEHQRKWFAWVVGVKNSLFLQIPIEQHLYWSLGLYCDEPVSREHPVGRDPRGPDITKKWILEQMDVYSDKLSAKRIVEATPASEITRWDIFDLVRTKENTKRWGHGRVTLLGDAAHAFTPWLGQGGTQSMEDAYDLAYRLSRSGEGEWAQQIEEYEKQRIPRTLRIRKEAAQNERVFMSDPGPVRRLANRILFPLFARSKWAHEMFQSWLLDYDNPSENLVRS